MKNYKSQNLCFYSLIKFAKMSSRKRDMRTSERWRIDAIETIQIKYRVVLPHLRKIDEAQEEIDMKVLAYKSSFKEEKKSLFEKSFPIQKCLRMLGDKRSKSNASDLKLIDLEIEFLLQELQALEKQEDDFYQNRKKKVQDFGNNLQEEMHRVLVTPEVKKLCNEIETIVTEWNERQGVKCSRCKRIQTLTLQGFVQRHRVFDTSMGDFAYVCKNYGSDRREESYFQINHEILTFLSQSSK